MDVVILALLGLIVLLLIFVVLRVLRDAPGQVELARLLALEQEHQQTLTDLRSKATTVETLLIDNARLEADLSNERRTTEEKLKLLEESEARLKASFENLANRIFEEKGKTFSEQNKERLSGLLQPFKEQLEGFRKRVDEVHKDDTERGAKLLEQVRQLQSLSNKVSDEANSLAKAIKGDAKQQGDWGELIVERMFEASGLEAGREYDTQKGYRDEDGTLKKPDFVVYLPDKKAVIVDAKVSLTAFERYANLEDETAREQALAEHLQSVRSHVNELREKSYERLLGNRALDFIIMCVPLEPAYQVALQHDRDLLYDCARTNVVITGPTTLMITLRLIAQIWRRENENRNAERIADRAGRMYDQVTLIYDAMSDAQRKLGNVGEAFDLAMKRLKNGRGNLIGRVEEIRRLGAKVNKKLPDTAVEDSLLEQENITP